MLSPAERSFDDWTLALRAQSNHFRREGAGFRFGPCPSCGGGSIDTGWLRRGRTGNVPRRLQRRVLVRRSGEGALQEDEATP